MGAIKLRQGVQQVMQRWEYLTAKIHEFGGDEAEVRRPGEYWVSEYGLLDLLQKLGGEGWEAVCNVGRDIIFKRETTAANPKKVAATVAIPALKA